MSRQLPLEVGGCRVLRPSEFEAIRSGVCRPEEAVLLDALLCTGMRYVEAQRFQWAGTKWWDGRQVALPKEAVLKHERKQKSRYVHLNPRGVAAVSSFLQCPVQLPSWWTWTDWMKFWARRAGTDPLKLGPKTTRKTWESWLMVTYPERWMHILLSQGHTAGTSVMHYLNLGFWDEDKAAMKPYVEGW